MGARRDEEWAPPVRLRRWGIVVEPRTDAHSTSRLALWSLEERAGVAPPGAVERRRRKVRFEVAPLSNRVNSSRSPGSRATATAGAAQRYRWLGWSAGALPRHRRARWPQPGRPPAPPRRA